MKRKGKREREKEKEKEKDKDLQRKGIPSHYKSKAETKVKKGNLLIIDQRFLCSHAIIAAKERLFNRHHITVNLKNSVKITKVYYSFCYLIF